MASSSAANPDTMVTFKVLMDGTNRRFKLPLRDLGASTLENKLRLFLSLGNDPDFVFERYSDSAGAYVVLDPENVSVYKQLYRAAKAKQKLKLRVVRKETASQETEPKAVPKPASVEDEAEAPKAPAAVAPIIAATAPVKEPASSSISAAAPVTPQTPGLVAAEAAFRKTLKEMEEIAQRGILRNLELMSPNTSQLPATRSSCRSLITTGCPAVSASVTSPVTLSSNYAVLCNSCDRTIPDAHYHCSTCDDGDFDLCQDCVNQGITCYGSDHWLIKRLIKDGAVINSTTETLAPKPRTTKVRDHVTARVPSPRPDRASQADLLQYIRTCNSCIEELMQHDFVHCQVCDDFDLCKTCFAKNKHGHNPSHGFAPAAEGVTMDARVTRYLAPGRNQVHSATCDGCDNTIRGIRHKCLDCPDWDYCSDCVTNAAFVHADHRFVPIYEQIEPTNVMRARFWSRPTHVGICCDGPLCDTGRGPAAYIVGDRYKCAVCNDVDFCAKCEASPANTHNKTHPLIKFKTPVRHVSVTTTGEHEGGHKMRTMGDQMLPIRTTTSSRATETRTSDHDIVKTNVVTVADVRPEPTTVDVKPVADVKSEAEIKPEAKIKQETVKQEAKITADDLVAIYKHDTIADGTLFPPNTMFEQTWVLRNEGKIDWPANCSVKFVGGDFMGQVEHDHPAGVDELASASESSVCTTALAPGQEFAFTVLLRTPAREGKAISYWRLTTPDGIKFGHRLWCDVNIRMPKVEVKSVEQSQMIFPKLDKESPVSSIHQEVKPVVNREEDYEDCAEDDGWAEDDSENGFLTDDEYDILDASDEEYLEEQQKKLLKK